jgi:hypothetical protein
MTFVVAIGLAGTARVEAPFKVGAAAVKITPSLERTVFLAGFDNNRRARGVHDDLYARALVIERGDTRIALVALDLIGLSNHRIRAYRRQVRAVPPDNVVIACTHVHSGPDTLGLWGSNPLVSGMDDHYMTELGRRVAQAVEEGVRNLRPARVLAGVAPIPPGIAKNSREPILDPDVHVLQFVADDGKPLGSLVHFGCHPEVMFGENHQITADYPGEALKVVEAETGATAVFFNGALGGMVTPDIRGERSFAEVKRVGEGVGAAALAAIRAARPVAGDALRVRRKSFRIPCENDRFRLLHGLRVIDGRMEGNDIVTDLSRIDLGEVRMVTCPGEVLPRPALELKPQIGGPAPLILALGEDELGYILDPADWGKKLYGYERSMSVGKQAWPRILAAARDLLGK